MRLFLRIGLYEVNNPVMQTVAELNAYRPDVLVGYTGALINLARKQTEGSLQISPRSISTAGEGMSSSEKAVLEAAFACPATNGYGSSEHLMMGMALNGTSSMLLLDDELIYEPAADHTLVTNLFNYTVPLIRYRMSDILRPVIHKTNPASPYLEVESVVGRTEIMPVFINEQGQEDSINPISIAEIFVAGVQRFQFQWLSNTEFNFLACLDPALNATQATQSLLALEQRWHEILAQKKLGNVGFKVQQVDEIPVNPRTRKFQLIVDMRNK